MPSLGVGGMSSQLAESLPVIEQINKEFQDPVSEWALFCLCVAVIIHNCEGGAGCITNLGTL